MKRSGIDPAQTVIHFGGLGRGWAGIDYCDSSGRVLERFRWQVKNPETVLHTRVYCFAVTRLLRPGSTRPRARRSHRTKSQTRGSPSSDEGDSEPEAPSPSRRRREGAA